MKYETCLEFKKICLKYKKKMERFIKPIFRLKISSITNIVNCLSYSYLANVK